MSKIKSSSILIGLVEFAKGNIGVLLGIIIISVVMSIITPFFATSTNAFNVLRQVSINAMLAMGMTFVILAAGIDLSVGPVCAVSGMLAVVLIVVFGYPVWIAILAALLIGLLCGASNGVMIAKTGIPPFIVTMAMMSIARGLTFFLSGGTSIRIDVPAYNIIGTGFVFAEFSYPVFYAVIIFIVLWFVLNHTKLGRHIYAVGGNRETARFCGINIQRTQIIVFTLSGFLAAFSGIVLTARMFTGQPSMGDGFELDAIAAVVLGGTSMAGGKGRLGGTILGVILIGLINNSLNLLNVPFFMQMVAKGVVILIAVNLDAYNRRKTLRVKKAKA